MVERYKKCTYEVAPTRSYSPPSSNTLSMLNATYPANAWNDFVAAVVLVPVAVVVVVVVGVAQLKCPMIVVVVILVVAFVDEAVAASKRRCRRPFRFGNGTNTTTKMLMNVP